jgi:hypothetical protein
VDRIEYTETAPSLSKWLAGWVGGADLEAEMHEVVGYRDGINPFTRQPLKFPILRRKGAVLDFSRRG